MVGIGSATITGRTAITGSSSLAEDVASKAPFPIIGVPSRRLREQSSPLRIFVGYDETEHAAWEVCRHSLMKHATVSLDIQPLKQLELRRLGLYRRAPNRNGVDCFDGLPFSTDFTFTRFLVPHLCMYDGWALFCDCDFMFRADVSELFALADSSRAILCVHHDHKPIETVKMTGQKQTLYPRKNWSSLVLWNCGHPVHKKLTVDSVNLEAGRWLHNFEWIRDTGLIGEIQEEWNWLEGYSSPAIYPKAVHFTRGGPWMDQWRDVAYADEWMKLFSEIAA